MWFFLSYMFTFVHWGHIRQGSNLVTDGVRNHHDAALCLPALTWLGTLTGQALCQPGPGQGGHNQRKVRITQISIWPRKHKSRHKYFAVFTMWCGPEILFFKLILYRVFVVFRKIFPIYIVHSLLTLKHFTINNYFWIDILDPTFENALDPLYFSVLVYFALGLLPLGFSVKSSSPNFIAAKQ